MTPTYKRIKKEIKMKKLNKSDTQDRIFQMLKANIIRGNSNPFEYALTSLKAINHRDANGWTLLDYVDFRKQNLKNKVDDILQKGNDLRVLYKIGCTIGQLVIMRKMLEASGAKRGPQLPPKISTVCHKKYPMRQDCGYGHAIV